MPDALRSPSAYSALSDIRAVLFTCWFGLLPVIVASCGTGQGGSTSVPDSQSLIPHTTQSAEVPAAADLAGFGEDAVCDAVGESAVREYLGITAVAWEGAKKAASLSAVCRTEDELNPGLSKRLGFAAQGRFDIDVADVDTSYLVVISIGPQKPKAIDILADSGRYESLPVDDGYRGVYAKAPDLGAVEGHLLTPFGFGLMLTVSETRLSSPEPLDPVSSDQLPTAKVTASLLMNAAQRIADVNR